MKKPDEVPDVAAAGAGGGLKAAVTSLLDRAAEREAQDEAWLKEQTEPAGTLASSKLPVYAEQALQYAPWLREIQQALRPTQLNGSKWILQIEELRERVAELLKILDSPRVIEKYLDEVKAMTPAYAGTGRVPQIIRGLTEASHGADRVPDLMRSVRGLVAQLKPRLQAEGALAPLVPEPTLTESRAHRSRFAKGSLSGNDAA